MKTILTFVLALATIVAVAVEKPRLDVFALSSERAVVALINEIPTNFELTVKSNNGRVVYYKQSVQASSEYRKIFDFSNLEDGNYELSVKVNNTLVKRSLEIANAKIKVGASELRFDPFFKVDGNLLKLSYLNFDQNRVAFILYKDGDVVYESLLGKEFNMQKSFDLSKLESGKYDVFLANGGSDYNFSFVK